MATTSAERMRWKRARDRGMVWGEGDESQLSDTALIEQLAIACQKAREGQGDAIALGLLREIAARIGLSGKSLIWMPPCVQDDFDVWHVEVGLLSYIRPLMQDDKPAGPDGIRRKSPYL